MKHWIYECKIETRFDHFTGAKSQRSEHWIYGEKKVPVALICDDQPTTAHLIAAAPEMLAMLKDIHSSECAKGRPFEVDTTRPCALCDLIAKAEYSVKDSK